MVDKRDEADRLNDNCSVFQQPPVTHQKRKRKREPLPVPELRYLSARVSVEWSCYLLIRCLHGQMTALSYPIVNSPPSRYKQGNRLSDII